MRLRGHAAMIVVAAMACSKQQGTDQQPGPPRAGDTGGPAQVSASPPDAGAADAGPKDCHLHIEAIAACEQRGDDFAYGRPYPIRCSGMAPTEEEQQMRREAAEQTVCQCYDRTAYLERQHECSMVP